MNIILTILGLLAPLIFGACLLVVFVKKTRLDLVEFLVLSFGLGGLLLTTLMFILSWFGLDLTAIKNIFIFLFLIGLIFTVFVFVNKKASLYALPLRLPKSFWPRILVAGLILFIGLQAVYVFAESWLRPIFQYDGVMNWAIKAKILFSQNRVVLEQNHPYFLGLAHRNYPLHVPLWELWQALAVGSWRESIIKIIFPLHYLGLILIFYLNLRRHLSITKTLVFTFFLATMPFVVYHAINDYVDLPLAFYLLVSAIYFWRGLEENNSSFLIIGALFAAGAAWTKNEGLFLGLINLLSVIVCQILSKKFKPKFIIHYSLFLILQLPWLIFKLIHHLSFANADGRGLFFKPAIFKILFSSLTTTVSWNIWWLIFFLVLIINWRKIFNREQRFWSLVVFGSIFFYLTLYVFTENYRYILDGTILHRNLLTIAPLTVFYTASLFR